MCVLYLCQGWIPVRGSCKLQAPAVAAHLEKIAKAEGLPIPAGFRFLAYLQGKADVPLVGNNVRDAIDQLAGVLHRKARAVA